MKDYDGWAIKYSWGRINPNSFQELRTQVVEEWDKDAKDRFKIIPELLWKNMGRRHGHKIVKVKLVEVVK